MVQKIILDIPPVDKSIYLSCRRTRKVGAGGKAIDLDPVIPTLDRLKAVGIRIPENERYPLRQPGGCRIMEQFTSPGKNPYSDFRVSQGQPRNDIQTVRPFRCLCLEKFFSHGNRIKNTAYRDSGPCRTTGFRRFTNFPCLDNNPHPRKNLRGARDQFGSGYGCNARQGFSPESKGSHPVKIIEFGNFARGVAGKGQSNILGIDTAPIVGKPDQFTTASFQFNCDFCRSCIQGIFQELLDDGRRSLHNLAGGNSVGQCFREKNDSAVQRVTSGLINGKRSRSHPVLTDDCGFMQTKKVSGYRGLKAESCYHPQSRTIITRHFFRKDRLSVAARIACASALPITISAAPAPSVFTPLTLRGLLVTLGLLWAAVRSLA